MAIPDLIKVEWFGEGTASLTFADKDVEYNRKEARKIECFFSTLEITEYENRITRNNRKTYVCPPGVSVDTWQNWLVYWEAWKEVYVNLSWVHNYREHCKPDFIKWYDDYICDYPFVIAQITDGQMEISDNKQMPDFTQEADDSSKEAEMEIVDPEDSKREWLDELYDKHSKLRYWIHLRSYLQQSGVDTTNELQEFFKKNAQLTYEYNSQHLANSKEDSDIISIVNSMQNVDSVVSSNEKMEIEKNKVSQPVKEMESTFAIKDTCMQNKEPLGEKMSQAEPEEKMNEELLSTQLTKYVDKAENIDQNKDPLTKSITGTECISNYKETQQRVSEVLNDKSPYKDARPQKELESEGENLEEMMELVSNTRLEGSEKKEEESDTSQPSETVPGPVSTLSILKIAFDFCVESFLSVFRAGWKMMEISLRMVFSKSSTKPQRSLEFKTDRLSKKDRKAQQKFLEWVEPLAFSPADVKNLRHETLVLKEFHYLEDPRETKTLYHQVRRDECRDVYLDAPNFEEDMKEDLLQYEIAEYKANENNPELPEELQKYWSQRFRLFMKYEKGIKLDTESWFSVTPEMIAVHQAQRCCCDVLVDAFCGAGGNAIQFAMTCNLVIAIDKDPEKIALASHNASIYGVADRIQFIIGDFLELAPTLKADVVFLSPPWGGVNYMQKDIYDVETLGGFFSCEKIITAAKKISNNLAIFLPKNSEICQIIQLAGVENKVDIEYNVMTLKTKSLTAYFGDLVHY